MAIRRLNDNMSIISALSDEPNDVDGLSSTELKAKFDAAGVIIKEYMNSALIPDVEAEIVNSVSDLVVQSGNMPSGGAAGQALIKASGEHFDWGFKTISEVPPGGAEGYILTKRTGEDFDARFEPQLAMEWELMQAYESAGTYTWTAPDIYGDGLPYSVGAYIIGGGGSGGSMSVYMSTINETIYAMATGGASGYAKCAVIEVTPGRQYPVVIGAGGEAKSHRITTRVAVRVEGNAGGASAFNGVTVSGGGGGWGANLTIVTGNLMMQAPFAANGGQGSDATDGATATAYRTMRPVAPAKGQATANSQNDTGLIGGTTDPASAYNRFDGQWYLAAGGQTTIYGSSANHMVAAQQGYTFDDGRKAGDGEAFSSNTEAKQITAQSATAPGCGGGAAVNRCNVDGMDAVSGAGADGAVYIYIRRRRR